MNNNEVKKKPSNLLSIENYNIQNSLERKVKNYLKKIAILKKKRNFNKENKDFHQLRQKKINDIEYKDDKNNENLIKPKILKDIKYGIDENGNPMKLDEYFKNLKNKKNPNKKQWPIAYILTDANNNNILVDLKGNEIIKNNQGIYEFPYQSKILINDFDVKHPELRINGERKYSIKNSPKIKKNKTALLHYDINHEKKNNIENNCNQIIEEISLQIDSCDTNESTFGKINGNNYLNCIFKKNVLNQKDKKAFSRLKYKKKHYKTNSINNFNYSFKNCNNKQKLKFKSFNKINTTKSLEFIERTNSILNRNKTIEDIYYKKYLDNNSNININKKNIKKNNIKYFRKEDLKEIFIPFSPNKYINKINSYTNFSIKNKFGGHSYYLTTLNNDNKSKSIKIIKNPKKKHINNLKNYFNMNYINKKDNTFTTMITSPSINIKNKTKKIIKDFKYNSNSDLFNIYNNSNNSSIRIKKNNTNKQLNKKQNENDLNNETLITNNYHKNSIKYLFKVNINNKNANTINNEEKNIFNKKNNFNKINNSNMLCKLIKKRPKIINIINPHNNNYSVLTKEANNMIKKYMLNKNIIIKPKNTLKISLLKEPNINNFSSRINNKKNVSFNKINNK